jgi:type VI secretion system secreted protein VgrG
MAGYQQTASPILISTPLGEDKVLLKSLQGEEQISGLFHYTLELVSEDDQLNFSSIVGQSVTVTFALPGGDSQYVNGVVGKFVQAGRTERLTTYFADLYPWLWLLTLHADCRIFQNKSTPDILKAVFSDLGFSDYKDALTRSYSSREYCVQYQESTFAFVSRLMEEEGIFYFFEHESSKHTLVLADDSDAFGSCPGLKKATIRQSTPSWEAADAIIDCALEHQVTVGQYKSGDYNFQTPATDLLVTASGSDPRWSVYEYPGGYSKKDDGETQASRRLASYEVPGKLLRGSSTCRAFHAGCKFTLADHYRQEVNGDYVLRSIYHSANQSEYTNTFEAFPGDVCFCPPRITPEPRVNGPQTALVVGKAGEEIWTDQYGRIKVKFHWDQASGQDENSSCWIRVSQPWAGKQWGGLFLPRIGQEVIVNFLDGNPDRPIVTGSVYNAQEITPYALPDEQTKSTIKSNSSKGGNGFNEIRFEDKAGSEEIFIQAQKDMNISVLNDQTSTIKQSRTTTIQEKDETLTVDKGNRLINVNTGNETHAVKGKRDLTITGAETHTNTADFTQNVSGNFTLKVSGNLTIQASGSVEIKAGTSLAAEAGTSLSNKAGTSLTNKAGTSLSNEADISLTSKANASQTVESSGIVEVKGSLVKIN